MLMHALASPVKRIWALLIASLALATAVGSLPLTLPSRRLEDSAVVISIALVAATVLLLVSHKFANRIALIGAAVALAALLLSRNALTEVSELAASMMVAVLIAVLIANSRPNLVHEDGEAGELFAVALIILTPVWGLYSIPVTFAHRMGLWPTAAICLVVLWGLPILAAWSVSRLHFSTTRQLLINVGLAGGAVVVTLAVLDIGVHTVGLDRTDQRQYEVALSKAKTMPPSAPDLLQEYRPNQSWEEQILSYDSLGRPKAAKDVTYTINNAGFRDSDFSVDKPPSSYRIALLGDSFAFGLGTKQDQIAAYLLEPLLSQRTGCQVEVYNFGIPAYATVNEAALFQYKVLDYHPDMVVVWYFLNDPNLKGTVYFLGESDTLSFFPIARDFSALARLVALRLGTGINSTKMIDVYREGYSLDDPRWQAVVTALQHIHELAQEHHITPVLFVHPILYQLNDQYPFKDIHSQVMATAQQQGFFSYDLFEAFKGQASEALWVSPVDQHPNETGHALAATYAAEKLSSLIPSCRPATK